MKKILIMSREYPPFIGGAGTVAYEYARALSKAHDVTVLTEHRGEPVKSSFGKYKIVTVSPTYFMPSVLMFRQFEHYNKYDLIILNDSSSIFFAGVFFSKNLLKKSISIFHGSEPENIYFNSTPLRKLIRYSYFYTRAVKFSKTRFAVSNYMKDKIKSVQCLSNLDVNVQYTPLEDCGLNSICEIDDEHIKIFNRNSNRTIYITASRVVQGKGYDNVFRAFEDAFEKGACDWHWLIVGDGEYLEKLKDVVSNSIIRNNVDFLGKVDRDYLAKLYYHSDAMVMLSDFKESFGLVFIEANMVGTPAIGFRRYGALEAIDDTVSGYLIDRSEDFSDIVINDRCRELAKTEILKHARKFTDATVIERINELML